MHEIGEKRRTPADGSPETTDQEVASSNLAGCTQSDLQGHFRNRRETTTVEVEYSNKYSTGHRRRFCRGRRCRSKTPSAMGTA